MKHILKRGVGVQKRKGSEFITSFKPGETVVGMVTFKNHVLIATVKGVYKYPRSDGKKGVEAI